MCVPSNSSSRRAGQTTYNKTLTYLDVLQLEHQLLLLCRCERVDKETELLLFRVRRASVETHAPIWGLSHQSTDLHLVVCYWDRVVVLVLVESSL